MKIKPLGERVLIELVKEEEVAKGGIIIPDSAKEKPQEGRVIAVGTGKLDENGKVVPFHVKKGGAMYIESSTVAIYSCSFLMNTAVSRTRTCLFIHI